MPLKPCKEGQFRNPETNRCKKKLSEARIPRIAPGRKVSKKVASKKVTTKKVASKKCRSDQYRNHITGRCKKVSKKVNTRKTSTRRQQPQPTEQTYHLFEKRDEYMGLNIIDLDVYVDDDSLIVTASAGKDYPKLFGNHTIENFNDDLVKVHLVLRTDETNGLIPSRPDEDDEEEYPLFLDLPYREDTPLAYEYRLAQFYVLVKNFLMENKDDRSIEEIENELRFFRGIGHSILCWTLDRVLETNNTVLVLEASGEGETQYNLVQMYKRLGFVTCLDIPVDAPIEYYVNSICMHSTFDMVRSKCKAPRFSSSLSKKSPNGNAFKLFVRNGHL